MHPKLPWKKNELRLMWSCTLRMIVLKHTKKKCSCSPQNGPPHGTTT